MNTTVRKRLGSTVAATVLVGGAVIVSASPAQAIVYYTVKNVHSHTCLTAGAKQSNGAASVFVASCNGSTSQQWTQSGSDSANFHLLKNRATGLCLMTDHKSHVNAVWASGCDITQLDQVWQHDFTSSGGYIVNRRDYITKIRTSPRAGAVYADDTDQTEWSYFQWTYSYV
ncbi:ricin-type beta-trefoil lectin domain protein [Kribbella sp. NPDC004138]